MKLDDRLCQPLADRYVIEGEIGRGGMGVVFRARDLQHERTVAIKILRPEIASAVGPERFQREIHIEASLQHPHIVPLYDSGTADGLSYFVMPYIDGETLRQKLAREGPLTTEEALRIAGQVAEALAFAHQRGVIHRDIKPENILLADGHAQVADFGIARVAYQEGESFFTATGMALGTPPYMSPEQATASRIDSRADQYSLACVIYEMLGGEPPYTGSTAQEIISKHVLAPIPDLDVLRPGVPKNVSAALRKAMAKLPPDRFVGMLALRDALLDPVPVRTVEDVFARRRRWTVAAAVLSAVVLVGAVLTVVAPRGIAWDPNRVVVFPLSVIGGGPEFDDAGSLVAELVGSALEQTEPLRWLHAGPWLSPEERADILQLRPDRAGAIARSQAARFRLDGSIVIQADSSQVILRLLDVEADTLVTQQTVAGPTTKNGLVTAAIEAVRRILPALLEPGRAVDLAAFEGRHPGAIASWMEGEREYRRSRFTRAIALYDRSIQLDSMLGLAALKGALAATWLADWSEARRLAGRAAALLRVSHERYGRLAVGLNHYVNGQADSALAWIQLSIDADSTWPESWMLAGELQSQLMPKGGGGDSSARGFFERALDLEPEFTPAALYLAQLAFRRGAYGRAYQLVEQFNAAQPDSALYLHLHIQAECIAHGPDGVPWHDLYPKARAQILSSAVNLARGATHFPCAEHGLRLVLGDPDASAADRWGALLALHGILASQRRLGELRDLLDSQPGGSALYMLSSALDLAVNDRADSLASLYLAKLPERNTPTLWLLSVWATSRDSLDLVSELARLASRRADSTGSRRDHLISRLIALHEAILTGSSGDLSGIAPTGGPADIEWQPWESLGYERLLVARSLVMKRDWKSATEVLRLLDHRYPVPYIALLGPALDLRLRAAVALRDADTSTLVDRLSQVRGRPMTE